LIAIAILGFPVSIGVICVVSFIAPVASAAEPTPADVLARLRAKDQQLDNARLDVVLFEQWNLKPLPAWKFKCGGNHDDRLTEGQGPREIRSTAHETLVVRGRDVTVIHRLEPDPSGHYEAAGTVFLKTSTAGGIWRRFSRDTEPGPGNLLLEVRPEDPVELNQEHAMFVEFCLGYGFGKRIRTIDRIERAAGLLNVEGSIQIWLEDESTFQLTLDDHYLVRDALIEANVKGNWTRFEVHTKETVAAQGVELAQRGLFKRIALGDKNPGPPIEHRTAQQDFKVLYKAVQRNLDDAAYQELIAMPLEPGTRVNDDVKNETYLVGEPRQPSGPAPAKP
jgi:hypothetical protein